MGGDMFSGRHCCCCIGSKVVRTPLSLWICTNNKALQIFLYQYADIAVSRFSSLLPAETAFPALQSGPWRIAALVSFNVALTYMNWRGLTLVGRTAILLTAFTIAPFLVMGERDEGVMRT